MAEEPSNRELAKKIEGAESRINKRLDGIDKEMQEFHDFMIVQQDRSIRDSKGNIDWSKFATQAAVFLTTCATAVYLVIEFLIKRAS